MTAFIQNINGLKLNHQDEIPLFEKTYIPPDYGSKLISRVYPDGSLYYLSLARETDNMDSISEKWNFISALTVKGKNEIRSLLEECCKMKSLIKNDGNVNGAIIWKVQCQSHIHEILFTGIPDGSYQFLQKIDDLISLNLQPIPPG